MKTSSYDLVVLGGGPAGTSGAIAAGILGKRVALVEKAARVGGAGINTGTIPSKTLRETSLMLNGWRARKLLGVDLSLQREATVHDFMCHSDQVTEAERTLVEGRLGFLNVDRFHGAASFVDPHTVRVSLAGGGETWLRGERILIATGSSPFRPPEFAFGDDRVHDSDEILELKAMPRRLAVVGAGVIGAEYAGTFAALGVEVLLIDGRERLLPFLDEEVSAALEKAMAANRVTFVWKEKVTACDLSRPGRVLLTLTSGRTLDVDGVLVCAGRSSNTETLDLAAAGLTPGKRGLVEVGPFFQSRQQPHVYAAGDVIGPPALAATGMEQARVAVCHAFGESLKTDIAPHLPAGIYTIPEASMVGETEASLKEKGIAYIAGRATYAEIPRGNIIGDSTGFLKLLFRADDLKLLGVHVVGEQATEVVHIGLIAMLSGAGADVFIRAAFNFPTLGDLYKYAAYRALLQKRALSGG